MSVALEDLKEPELNRKTKGRPQGTKRLPTKQELIEAQVQVEKRKQQKRTKANEKGKNDQVPKLRLVLNQHTTPNSGTETAKVDDNNNDDDVLYIGSKTL